MCGHEPHFFASDNLLDNVPLTPSIFKERVLLCEKSAKNTSFNKFPRNILVGTIGLEPTTPTMSR